MVGDGTAFASLVFGYFFYWTIHPDFTGGLPGPGHEWPLVALALFTAAWLSMLAARHLNIRGNSGAVRAALALATGLTMAAAAAAFSGPWSHAMDPTEHVYPAIVWVLVIWLLAHAGVGVAMQLYCMARSFAGRLTPVYDMDLRNVVLYWHFLFVTALTVCLIVGLFPLAL
jgi:cytochrome c oxidase subunit I+III